MKRRWIKRLCVALIVAILALTVAAGVFMNRGYGITVGRFLEGNGGPMLIDGNTPICLSARGNDEMFSELSTGDRILVIHDGIAETYPAQTGVYACLRLGTGDPDAIPQSLLQSLKEIGWYGIPEG